MSIKTHKTEHRILAGLLALLCLVSVLFGAAPRVYAADAVESNIELFFGNSDGAVLSEDGTRADYTVSGSSQPVIIVLRVSANYALDAGRLKIKIPLKAFQNRDGSNGYDINSSALNNLIGTIDRTSWSVRNESSCSRDGYLEIWNNDVSALQSVFTMAYDVNSFTVEDEAELDFGVEVEDSEGKLKQPDDITASFDTHVKNVGFSKVVSDNFAPNGCYYEWHESIDDRFPGIFESEEDFNAQCEDYYFVCYKLSPSANTSGVNQKSTLYINEIPENGEVVAVSHSKGTEKSGGDLLEKVPSAGIIGLGDDVGEYVWKYESWMGTTPSPFFFSLVKYPKNGNYSADESGSAVFSNTAGVTFVGVDHPDNPETAYSGTTRTSVWQDANAGDFGDIWGVYKAAHDDPIGALSRLRNGRDVPFSYDVTGVGLTYKYVAGKDKNFDAAVEADYGGIYGGPYRLEVVDDAMYVNGLGDEGMQVARLQPDDFHFRTFTMTVKHDVIEEVDLKGDIASSYPKPIEERTPVKVYVMTEASPDEWVYDQTIENIPLLDSYDRPSDKSYGRADDAHNGVFEFNNDKVYRVKFVYDNANGDIQLKSTLTGVLRAEGETVQRVIENIGEKDLSNFQLFNWDAEMGYDGNGNWEDPKDSDTIKDPTPEDMKNDLLDLDAGLYDDHNTNRIANRQVGKNNLTEAHFYSGAAKVTESSKWNSESLELSYLIAAVEGAGATTKEDLEEMVDMGLIKSPTEVVFKELLPVGAKFVSAEAITLRGGPSNPNYASFPNDHFNWDSSFAGRDSGYFQSQVTIENEPEIIVETEDIFIDDGTVRQMATITVRYGEGVLPIAQLGLNAGGINYGLGTALRVKAVAKQYDITGVLNNNFAAYFVDENGETLDLEGASVHPDDGSVFEEIHRKDGESVFEDTDGDNDTGRDTVVGANVTDTESMQYTGTQLIKWIKEDQLDSYFKNYTQTYAGHNYTYKIQFFTNNGTVKNVVIYDSIEEAYTNKRVQKYDDERHWKGTLRGVDISEAKHAGFDDIKVYVNKNKFYSDAELATDVNSVPPKRGLSPADLTAANGWEIADPDDDSFDWENVKTIAFSIGENTYFGESYTDDNGELHDNLPSSVSIYLKMTAPDTISPEQTETEQVLAYNNPAYYSEQLTSKSGTGADSWSKATTVANTVTIGMKSATADIPAVTKEYSGNLPAGFEEDCVFEIKPIGGTAAPRAYDKESGEWGDVISSVSVSVSSGQPTAVANENGSLFFTEPGVHEYEISETAGEYSEVTYSKAKYKVVFTVTDEREVPNTIQDNSGKYVEVIETPQYAENTLLDVDVKIFRTHDENGSELAEPEAADSIKFVNTYNFEPLDTELEITKKIEGAVPETDETYTFEIKGSDGSPAPGSSFITVTGENKGNFSLEYTGDDIGNTYTYEITEVAGENDRCKYDKTVYVVTDTITEKDGELVVSRVITADGQPAEEIVFVNTYVYVISIQIDKEWLIGQDANTNNDTAAYTDEAEVPETDNSNIDADTDEETSSDADIDTDTDENAAVEAGIEAYADTYEAVVIDTDEETASDDTSTDADEGTVPENGDDTDTDEGTVPETGNDTDADEGTVPEADGAAEEDSDAEDEADSSTELPESISFRVYYIDGETVLELDPIIITNPGNVSGWSSGIIEYRSDDPIFEGVSLTDGFDINKFFITEDDIDGYSLVDEPVYAEINGVHTFTFTNKEGPNDSISIVINKQWLNANNTKMDGSIAPDVEIKAEVFYDETQVDTISVSKNDGWSVVRFYTTDAPWAKEMGLRKFEVDKFRVVETTDVPGFETSATASQNGKIFTIINKSTFTPSEPSTPSKPSEPSTPSTPSEPETPEEDVSSSAGIYANSEMTEMETTVTTVYYVYAMMAVAAAAAAVIIRRRRQK